MLYTARVLSNNTRLHDHLLTHQTFESAEKAGRAIEAARPHALGFDIEWQVSFVPGEVRREIEGR